MLNGVLGRKGKIVTDLLDFYGIDLWKIYENFKMS